MNPRPSILICRCDRARVFPAKTLELVLDRLTQAGVAFETVPDLCELAARHDPRLTQWSSGKIAACFPRAVKWLFAAAGTPLSTTAELVNLRATDTDATITALLSAAPPPAPGNEVAPNKSESSAPPADWPAWFPVIDYDLCSQCMQCLGFCLFGVYGLDADQRIQVTHPDQCKTNCPACARVCPHGAIIFPKHGAGPINGDEVSTTAPKLDISTLLGGDAYSLLRDRSARAKTRFSKDRSGEEAASERRRHLTLHGLMAEDIPAEVLSSLPSPEVIAQKVEEAAARARAALQARKHL